MSDPAEDLRAAVARKGSFLQTVKAVAWSFFGVRRGVDHQQDLEHINPVHVIVAGVLAGILFVLVLVWVAGWAVQHAGELP